jgi:eukaryotic-like serine/threonine-protein kinase
MDAPVQEGDMLAGKYRVEKVLGFGGMGVVVSAFRGDLEQRVAVKFLSHAAAERPDAAERFRREARAAAKIRSEHVARVLDVGTLDTGLPFMVMEFLEGNDLAEELQRHVCLPIEDAVEYILQAIEALAEAHAGGVVHRDLKPSNLFLAQRADGSRRIKVLDFGISKALSGSSVEDMSLTKTAALIGSPLYMAPEQMRSAKDVDTRADIWSLGAMLYEMLSGQLPYTGESVPQVCAALLHDDPIPLRQHRPEVPEGLELVVLRCLAKDRAQRFPSVFELGRALLPYAMPASRVHVDRAERVLRVSDVTISGLTPVTERLSEPFHSVPSPLTTTPVKLAMTPEPVAPQPVEPTVNSWGQSRAGQASSKRGALLAVGGIVAMLAAGVGMWLANKDEGTGAGAATVAAAPAAKRAPEPEPEAEPPVSSTPLEAAGALSAAPAALAVTPSAPTPAQLPGRAKLKPVPVKPATKKPEPAKPTGPAPAPGGLTDFGGRR